jgi:hypothetical protein
MTPNPDPDLARLERQVIQAAESLVTHDGYLLACDLNERSITHKFAEHLQRKFPEWNVDCEYNRDYHDPKRLDLPSRHDAIFSRLVRSKANISVSTRVRQIGPKRRP